MTLEVDRRGFLLQQTLGGYASDPLSWCVFGVVAALACRLNSMTRGVKSSD